MAKKYELTGLQNRLYFAQYTDEGGYLALQASDYSEAVIEVISMCDFEGAVEDCAILEGITVEDAYDIVYTGLRDSVISFTPQEVMEMARNGHSFPLQCGWVAEMENTVIVNKAAETQARKAALKPAAKKTAAPKPVKPADKAAPSKSAATAKAAAKKTAPNPKPAAKKAAASKPAKPADKAAPSKSAATAKTAAKKTAPNPKPAAKKTDSPKPAKPVSKAGKTAAVKSPAKPKSK